MKQARGMELRRLCLGSADHAQVKKARIGKAMISFSFRDEATIAAGRLNAMSRQRDEAATRLVKWKIP